MHKVICGFWLLCCVLTSAFAQPQDTSTVEILRARFLNYESRSGAPVQKLIGEVAVLKDSTYFYCDSAYIYELTDFIEAFNRVRVVMPDSVELRGDRLTYDPSTRIAEVYNNITLTDYSAFLYTNRLTYYRNDSYGYYSGGGKLINQTDTLTSDFGYYYTQEKMTYFQQKVRLVSPDYTLLTDTLGYHTENKIATFLAATTILSEDGEIITSRGFYDTQNRKIELYRRSTVKDSSYQITADSLFFDDNTNLGYAFGNVIVQQSDSSMEVRGNYGRFNRKTEESYVTKEAVAIQFMEDDTLYIFADTLFTLKIASLGQVAQPDSPSPDSLSDRAPLPKDSLTISDHPLPSDSLAIQPMALVRIAKLGPPFALDPVPDIGSMPPDTVFKRVFLAYPRVSLFMKDVQGRADSAIYFYDDSTMFLHRKPILWSGENQLTGDTVKIWMRNQKIDSMWIGERSFVVGREDTVGFNQIKGKELRAKFQDNELRRLHIIGNAESIYFLRDDKDTARLNYVGMNQAFSQQMMVYLRDNKARKIVFLSKADGTLVPMFQALLEANRLEGMEWRIGERPERPDIFPKLAPLPDETAPMPEDLPQQLPLPEPESLPGAPEPLPDLSRPSKRSAAAGSK